MQCGSYQRLDDDVWPRALEFAHAVADLAGPQPEGRYAHPEVWIGDDNPHKKIGRTETFAEQKQERFQIDVSPGHPICKTCKALEHVSVQQNVLTVRCARCQANGRFGTPPEITEMARGLVAVCAEAHRLDMRAVQVSGATAGLQALACPTCGANLPPVNQHTVECTYCHATAFVPPHGRVRGKGHLVRPIVFWVAFHGPSQARLSLARPTRLAGRVEDHVEDDDLARLASLERKEAEALIARHVQARTKPTAKSALKKLAEMKALPGIELLPEKAGPDTVQVVVSIAATLAAIGLGYLVALAVWL